MSYKFLDDVAIADVAFEATGKTLAELLEASALALTNSMVKDLSTISLKKKFLFKIQSHTKEQLLHDFLQELIFYKDAKLLLFGEYHLSISQSGHFYTLEAKLKGEKINMKKHELLVDVKAVSWHRFSVEESKKGWEAFVILDV